MHSVELFRWLPPLNYVWSFSISGIFLQLHPFPFMMCLAILVFLSIPFRWSAYTSAYALSVVITFSILFFRFLSAKKWLYICALVLTIYQKSRPFDLWPLSYWMFAFYSSFFSSLWKYVHYKRYDYFMRGVGFFSARFSHFLILLRGNSGSTKSMNALENSEKHANGLLFIVKHRAQCGKFLQPISAFF